MRDALTPGLLARIETLEAELGRLKAELGRAAVATECDADELTPSPPVAEEPSRRELLRYGAVALGTTAAAALAARPATGANGDPILLGSQSNVSTSVTEVLCTGVNQNAFLASAQAATGGGIGVVGLTSGPNGSGVHGFHPASGSGAGVRGTSFSPNGFAVRGTNLGGGTAVRGEIPGTVAADGIAVYGLNNSSFAGPSPGAGGFGVYGLSAKGHGLVGATATAGGAAVVGATNGVAGAWAAAFYGPVIVGGDFIVVGGAKSAAVPHPDGTHRQLYCVESPESWFEDFGTGTFVNGKVEIAIEPGFGSVAEMENYHVFLTAYDHDHGLHVTKRTPKGFVVEADTALAALKGHQEGELSGTFSWRVVAKRKDITGERFAVITMPPEPVLPPIQGASLTCGSQVGAAHPDWAEAAAAGVRAALPPR
jgi:hypothetical protein